MISARRTHRIDIFDVTIDKSIYEVHVDMELDYEGKVISTSARESYLIELNDGDNAGIHTEK